ncbi:MAG TPA: hypothetical protein VMR18_01750 [Candidatus Saccharimonadales bacterium]|nr:hypothetical protein [Candidatus Saccharimonadales bacterium]
MADQIQFRRDTAANWTSNNPTLAEGEVGLETDTNSYKIGDGSTSWTSLSYRQLAPEITTLLLDGQSSDPSIPASGDLVVYSKAIAGRMMLKQEGSSGLHTAFQPLLARNKIGYWCPPGNNTTVPGVFGFTAYTVVTTAVTRNIATTNLFTRMRRLGFPSSASAGTAAGARVAVGQITVGDGSGNGGFFKVIRWGISDTTFKSACRTFIGISSSTAAPSNVEPNSLTNSIGMGHGAADTTMHIYYGGSSAQTPIDLGVNFPANTSNIDVYELALFAPSSSNNTVYYEVNRINTGDVATGTLTGTAGTVLPASSQLLTYSQNWRNNNGNAFAVSFDIMSDYIETDN